MFPTASLTLKGRAMRALAARELTRMELQAKLAAHVPSDAAPSTLEDLLNELQAKGYLSDVRAAQALSNRRAPKLGTQRVLQELRARGADAEAVAEVAAQLRGTELERAQAVWRKKFAAPASSAAERAKQMRFLAGRGFAPGVIGQVLRGEPEDSGDTLP